MVKAIPYSEEPGTLSFGCIFIQVRCALQNKQIKWKAVL